ncbi:hypothetical protein, partial [uncultured Candidatus Kuenenia sp.]|uniref:hypothetical protein n=1 Tax=uncultured Candidatus Kuenenia sp. TaxID=1048336 RepID=UPI0025CE504A
MVATKGLARFSVVKERVICEVASEKALAMTNWGLAMTKACHLNPANDFRNAKISIFHYQDWQKAITDIRFLAIVVALLYYFK